jgi:hypothetical protein
MKNTNGLRNHDQHDPFHQQLKDKTMNTDELKRSFHNLIDNIENESLLMGFYEVMKNRASIKDGELWERLSMEEQTSLLETLEEAKNPENVISQSVMKKKHSKWL